MAAAGGILIKCVKEQYNAKFSKHFSDARNAIENNVRIEARVAGLSQEIITQIFDTLKRALPDLAEPEDFTRWNLDPDIVAEGLIKKLSNPETLNEGNIFASNKQAHDLAKTVLREAFASLKKSEVFWSNIEIYAQAEVFDRFSKLQQSVDDGFATNHKNQAEIIKSQAVQGEGIEEVLAYVRAQGKIDKAKQSGISEPALRAIVSRLKGDEGLQGEELLQWLDAWIENAREELTRGRNEDAAFSRALEKARAFFAAGQLDKASGALMEELAVEQKEEAHRQEERMRRRKELLRDAIRFDLLALNVEAATQKYLLLATEEGIKGPDALGGWLFDEAGAHYDHGDKKGDNTALLISISLYQEALKEYTRERVPLDWAMTQNNLGTVLSTLGERENNTQRLDAAVQAYEEALKEYTRERVPLKWAMTQNNLGTVLSTLGERENNTQRLDAAVQAHEEALKEYTRERVPLQWAVTQNNLGTALRALGERESGTKRLDAAVRAYEEALKEFIRERVPLQWAMTQNNLEKTLALIKQRKK